MFKDIDFKGQIVVPLIMTKDQRSKASHNEVFIRPIKPGVLRHGRGL